MAVIRFGSPPTGPFTLLASAGTAVLLPVAPALPWLGLVLLFLCSAFANMLQVPQQARLIGLYPTERGLMPALNSSILYVSVRRGVMAGERAAAAPGGRAPHLAGFEGD